MALVLVRLSTAPWEISAAPLSSQMNVFLSCMTSLPPQGEVGAERWAFEHTLGLLMLLSDHNSKGHTPPDMLTSISCLAFAMSSRGDYGLCTRRRCCQLPKRIDRVREEFGRPACSPTERLRDWVTGADDPGSQMRWRGHVLAAHLRPVVRDEPWWRDSLMIKVLENLWNQEIGSWL